ncbi:hypothetical protein BP00DRAFT_87247 [Aspergillus indologenus CBS 114.80]|uniref:Uncharacterized protein n=1 Tax=Aspergillus indologenus CBS 114.80 TaxID=1450541 RepID=A0A2V5HMM0_9EURO|nr:hypothetical protein BP00DRAFT_87247 [Aspergillus indologenus CBS 114.80]
MDFCMITFLAISDWVRGQTGGIPVISSSYRELLYEQELPANPPLKRTRTVMKLRLSKKLEQRNRNLHQKISFLDSFIKEIHHG